MSDWWHAFSGTEQWLVGLGIFSTTLCVLQTMMTLLGLSDDAPEHDIHDSAEAHWLHGLWQYFTVRNGVHFFVGLSWGTLMLRDWGLPLWLAFPGGVGLGTALIGLMGGLMAGMLRLESPGSDTTLERTIGEEGVVDIRIPALGKGYGKVTLVYDGRLRELEALTEGTELRRGNQQTA